MINTTINRKATVKVARALGDLNDEVVFVGGAMVSLYIDSKGAEDVRPTKDLDLSFQITSLGQLELLRQKLVARGFSEARDQKAICRFTFEDLLVDVMSTQAIGWAPANRWFKAGFDKAISVAIEEQSINILPLSYFLAAKLDAFFARGINNPYTSRDMEDIVYLFNYIDDIEDVMNQPDKTVNQYIQDSVLRMLSSASVLGAMSGHIYPAGNDEIMQHVLYQMKKLTHGL